MNKSGAIVILSAIVVGYFLWPLGEISIRENDCVASGVKAKFQQGVYGDRFYLEQINFMLREAHNLREAENERRKSNAELAKVSKEAHSKFRQEMDKICASHPQICKNKVGYEEAQASALEARAEEIRHRQFMKIIRENEIQRARKLELCVVHLKRQIKGKG
jgi:hypothetical protein